MSTYSGPKFSVTLDSCVFFGEKEKFNLWQLNNEAFRRLCALNEAGAIHLVLSNIVEREVREKLIPRIATDIATAHTAHVAALGGDSLDLDQIKENLLEQFADFGARAQTVPPADGTVVLDHYFQGVPPFGPGSKRKEFPDAFALLGLRDWAAENGDLCVVSSDSDWRGACGGNLKYYKSLEELLAHILRQSGDAVRLDAIANATRVEIRERADEIQERIDAVTEVQIFHQGSLLKSVDFHSEVHSQLRNIKNCSVYRIDARGAEIRFSALVEAEIRVRLNCEIENPELDDNPNARPLIEVTKIFDLLHSFHIDGLFHEESSEVDITDIFNNDEVSLIPQLDRAPGGKWIFRVFDGVLPPG